MHSGLHSTRVSRRHMKPGARRVLLLSTDTGEREGDEKRVITRPYVPRLVLLHASATGLPFVAACRNRRRAAPVHAVRAKKRTDLKEPTMRPNVPSPSRSITRSEGVRSSSSFCEVGTLAVLARLDDRSSAGGDRIGPAEVAAALDLHPLVETSAVVLRGGDDPTLVAYVVADPVSATALRGFLADRVPDDMIPAQFVGLPALPIAPNGKLDRAALPDPCPDNLLPDGPQAVDVDQGAPDVPHSESTQCPAWPDGSRTRPGRRSG